MEKVLYSIFVVNLDKINITMIQVSDTAKRKSSIWWRGRFWRCYRLRKSSEKRRMFCLSYDLKFDKTKAKTIKYS
jgi:hypothetical protein